MIREAPGGGETPLEGAAPLPSGEGDRVASWADASAEAGKGSAGSEGQGEAKAEGQTEGKGRGGEGETPPVKEEGTE